MVNPILLVPLVAILIFILAGIRVIKQYERAVKFRLGVFVGLLEPGLKWIIPVVDRIVKVDLRVVTTDIPSREVISKDNVPMKINGVVFFRVTNADKAILEVEQYRYAISQLAQSALRDIAGKSDLDTILAKREELGEIIRTDIDSESDPWGIKVTDVKIKDIEIPDNMKRSMAHQAEAERDRRARIILAEGEEQAAKRLANAGDILDKSPSAIKLRLYQNLKEIGYEKNSTIIFPFPEEMLEFLRIKKDKK